MNVLRKSLLLFVAMFATQYLYSQCCAGGSGSPIAGGSSQGVLMEKQMEFNSNYQFVNTTKFYTKDHPDTNFLDRFSSQYLYSRIAYGISKNFTMSVEAGYWLNKTEIGLHKVDTNMSQGIGDLILFPRYDLINKTTEKSFTELTLGLGFKIPLGKYNDSTSRIEPFLGDKYYITKPLAVQTSSGSQDLIFYSFFLKSYPKNKLKFFASSLYVKKGWNPVGEKMGDYASVGIFVSKQIKYKYGITLQLKGEWVDKMKLNKNILLYAYPNYNPEATGSKKVFLIPQFSYSFKNHCTMYLLSELPLYQYVTETQIASQYQFTFGVSYRFMTGNKIKGIKKG